MFVITDDCIKEGHPRQIPSQIFRHFTMFYIVNCAAS